ncbi:hypothetical protein P4O66_001085 [Electrophorus voltai]|uniref:Uncharacterized protein n=1 Tax=Electrophorus voltai TaxID=2609070 RepID=A0AAD9DVL0_9TELE|nr:hypothetical protein P4O66_001085 [Electrophorus voltai]
MVTSKQTCAVVIALHQNGFTGKEIAACKTAPKSNHLSNHQELQGGSIAVKKASGHPRKSRKCQDRLLKRMQLQDRVTTSACTGMAEGRCECICTHSKAKAFGGWLGVKKCSKEVLSHQEKYQGQTDRKYRDWTAEDWGKVICSVEAPFRLFGTSGQMIVQRRTGERYHEYCVMSTVRHPETSHVWGYFSSKGVGLLKILPKNTAMNEEWYQNIIQKQRLPMIQENLVWNNAFSSMTEHHVTSQK